MRSLLSLLQIAGVLVIPVQGASLRRVEGGLQIQADVSELPRKLQAAGSTYENGVETDGYTDDATLLNELIAYFLPDINAAFQALVPDPLNLPFAGTFEIPEIDLLVCKASAAFDYDMGKVVGLSSFAIDDLKVITGTEKVNAGCLATIWSALFDMTIASVGVFTVKDLLGGFSANGCGLDWNDQVTGGVNTYQPSMRGAVSISGNLVGKTASITLADIGDPLQVGYKSIEGFLNDVPSAWNLVIGDATRALSESMKDELTNTVEPTVNPKAEKSIEGQQITMTYTQALALNGRFVRNGVRRSIQTAYQDVTNFVGNAVGFVGFGDGGSP